MSNLFETISNPHLSGRPNTQKRSARRSAAGWSRMRNLRSICAEPGMPAVPTVSSWISNNREFRDIYALAREFQAHCILDEVIELVDEVSTEWVEKVRANGRVVRGPDRKNLPRCRLRCEVRHWVADQLLARARQLSARTLFEPPTAPEFEILQGLSLNSSHIVKGHRND